ncbi:MAG: phosphoglucosamine mutase [Firmicutes bacterium]|nr:phosphoglucosamine mutase [Alicyclobacillaceae bacterium]MCL6497486.1 phosphoglucosamine mutase [Bacillota bacterium]
MSLFGTDGARGIANAEMTPELALSVGLATGTCLPRPATVLVGRDTRVSGPMLEAALSAGLAASGVEVLSAGLIPTPALAHLIPSYGAAAGIMISASHNPPAYNGIKLLSEDGGKWDPAVEAAVEAAVAQRRWTLAEPVAVGNIVSVAEEALARYRDHLVGLFRGQVAPVRVVVDLAWGAAVATVPAVLEALGVQVEAIHALPRGRWINQGCGATHPEALSRAVVERGADVGLAFDGDADRLIAVDHRGRVVDGDGLLYLLTKGWIRRGELGVRRVVATVMANLGLEQALARIGVALVRTPVGDRWVAQALKDSGSDLGGEQSGHIILRRWAETGDGLLTALAVLREMAWSGRSLAELVEGFEPFPQVLRNLTIPPEYRDWRAIPGLAEAVAAAEAALGQEGRVLVRRSGTEPLLRVMVEGRDAVATTAWADRLAAVVEAAVGPARAPS